jgi:uncharacterized repeat protein (TIGR01451 family)
MKFHSKYEGFRPIVRRGILGVTTLATLFSFAQLSSAQSTATQSSALKKSQTAAEYGKLPLSFEKNEGQAPSNIKFLARGQGYTLALTSEGAILGLHKQKGEESQPGKDANPRIHLLGASPSPEILGMDELLGKVNYILGNDPTQWRTNVPTYAKVIYKNVYPGIDMVYRGDQGKLEFDFIVHPGADPKRIQLDDFEARARVLEKSGSITYDYPGGKITLNRPFSYVPARTKREEIASNFVVRKNGHISFWVEHYNPAETLVIDPSLSYSTFLGGGTTYFAPSKVAVDGKGEAIVIGTARANFPTTAGAFQTTAQASSGEVPFILKLNSTGTALVYATFLGGTNTALTPYPDSVTAVAADSAGNAYLTGGATNLNFPTTTNVFQSAAPCLAANRHNGVCTNVAAFVTELNPAGSGLVFSTFLGGTTASDGANFFNLVAANGYITPGLVYSNSQPGEVGTGIAVDSTGVYVGGMTSSIDFPVTNGGGQTTPTPNEAPVPFLAKLSGGSLIYATFVIPIPYLGGPTSADAFTIDTSGNAYISGRASSNFPTTSGVLQESFGNGTAGNSTDCSYVAKMNPSGTALVYATLFGCGAISSTNWQLVYTTAMAADSAGNAYITGEASNNGGSGDPTTANLPTTPGSYQPTCPAVSAPPAAPRCGLSAFASKINPTGTALVYSTYLGPTPPAGAAGLGIAVDSVGEAVVVGGTVSAGADTFPTTSDALQTSCLLYGGNCYSGFVSKLSADGSSLVYSTYLGGSQGVTTAFDVALDGSGEMYVTGGTYASDFPTTTGAFDNSLAGFSTTGFLVKLSGTSAGTITLQPATLPAGAAHIFYGPVTFAQTGGTGTITWTESGTLPTGITFVGGVLQGIPTTSGTFPITITAKDSAGDQGSVSVSLFIYAETTATISAQSCSSTPITTFDFGPVPVGTTNGQYICLNNTGTSNLYISISTLLPPTTYFNVGPETCNILESTPPSATNGIAPGSSCNLLMNFSPSAVGPTAPVFLSFVDNAGSQTISLTGAGLARTTAILSAGTCSVSAAPIINLDFGSVLLGTSAQQTLCVTNTGNQNPLYLTAIFPPILMPFTKVSDNCPRGVPPASTGIPPLQSCQFVISFTPTQAATYSGTGTQFYDNAGTQPLTLSGTGVSASADVSIAPSGSVSGTVGTSMSLSFTVKNNGPSPTTSTTLTNTLPTSFTFVSASPGCSNASGVVTCTLGSLAVNQSVTITITVNPTASGSNMDTAAITSMPTDPNSANNSATITAQVSTTTTGGGGPVCLCNTDANYVNPANGVAPVAGATSPHGKYTLSAAGTSQINLIVKNGNTTVLNQTVPSSTAWGFSPDDDRFVTDQVVGGTETITLYNLAAGISPSIASTSLLIGAASNGGNPSQVLFSPSGNYLLYVALTANSTSSQFNIYNAKTGKMVFNSTSIPLVSVAGTGEDQFGLVSYGFSPGSPETSFLYAFVSGSTSVQWNVVSLGTNKTTANGTVLTTYTAAAYWQYSPCGDVLALVQQPSQSSLEVTLYQVSTGKQISDNSNLAFGNLTLSSSTVAQVASVQTVTGIQAYNLTTNCPAPPIAPHSSAQLTATTGQLTIDGSGNYIVPLTIQNTGSVPAANVALSSAALAATVSGKPQSTATSTTLPASLGTIAVGNSATVTITFPAEAGAPASAALLRLAFTFTGGSASSTLHATLP